MTKFSIGRILICLCLISMILLLVRFSYTKLHNEALTENFDPNKNYTGYLDNVPIEEIDFELLHQRFHYASVADVNWYNEVIPEKNIYYYAGPDENSEIVFTLYAGEKYYLGVPGMCPRTESWPTYTRGWRYAKPLFTEAEYQILTESEGAPESLEDSEYGYIRLSDLRTLVFTSVYASPYLKYYTTLWERMSWHFADFQLPGLYGFDWILWNQGVHISPDLYLPYWRLTEKILGVFVLLSGGGAVCCCILWRGRKML